MRLFLEHGYRKVTVNDIAAEASLAAATVYASAGGKAAILATLIDEAMRDPIVEETLSAVRKSRSGDEVLRAAAAAVDAAATDIPSILIRLRRVTSNASAQAFDRVCADWQSRTPSERSPHANNARHECQTGCRQLRGEAGPRQKAGVAVVNASRSGHCLCGRISYRFDAELDTVILCHWDDCQRHSGAAFSVNVLVARNTLEIRGTPRSYRTIGSENGNLRERLFCGDCGSPIFTLLADQPDVVIVKAGTLDDRTGIKPSADVWWRRAQGWLAPHPTRARFDGDAK